jgi:hypothetical protein
MTRQPIPAFVTRSLAIGLWLVPPVLMAVLLWRDCVNVPFWDEWDDDSAGLFIKFKTGQLTFGDLWVQHNESRFVLPRIFFLLLGGFTHWNLDYEVATTFLLACVIAGAVFWLERPAFTARPAAQWTVFFISSLLIFSPAQFEAWLWGMELILYLPLLCILFSLFALRSNIGEKAKWFFCAAMAVAGTYSFSNGLLVWIVLFPVMFLTEGWSGLRKKSRAALCWLLAFVGNAAVYFHDYHPFQPSQSFWQMLWTNPLLVAHYFLVFLGGPLTDRNSPKCVRIASVIGLVVVILVAAVCIGLFRWRKNQTLTRLAWPWLAVGGYGILSALLATAGRSALGLEQALSSRYGIFGITVMLALAHLLPLLAFHRPVKNDFALLKSSWWNFALAALAAAIILLHALAFSSNVFNFSIYRLNLLLGQANLQFLDVLAPQPSVMRSLYPDYPRLKKTADTLNQLGVRQDDLLKTTRLADFKSNSYADSGSIETIRALDDGVYLSGWALSARHYAAADCILFTFESAGVEPQIFALMDDRFMRPDLVAKFHDRIYFTAGWEKTIHTQDLPKGALTLKAWTYDVQTRQVAPLQNEVNFDNK